LGISLLPGSVFGHDNQDGLAVVSLAPAPRLSMLAAVREGDRSPLVRDFLAAMKKSARRKPS
jgi:hypothetical protein